MATLIARWFIVALALLLAQTVLPGIEVVNFYIALIVAIILGIVNLTLRPLFILLTLPLSILTLGLFTLVINALLFWFVASFVEGFLVSGFGSAFLGALFVSVVKWLGDKFIQRTQDRSSVIHYY